MLNPLFEPIQLGPLSLQNRIVMAPMTRTFSPGNVPNDKVVEYYARRAENEVGLIITEGTPVGRALLQDPEWVIKVKANRLEELQDFSKASLMTLV